MKKIALSIIFFLLLGKLGWAQIAVGDQDGVTSFMPVYGLYEYSYSQQIVLREEIKAEGEITSVSFYYVSGTTTNSTNWTIYMGHTGKTSFSGNDDWIDSSNLTEVYSGSVIFPSAENFMEVVFSVPFEYNNSDNLVIAVTETEPGWGGTLNFGKTATVPNSKRGIYFRSDTVVPDPANPPTANGTADYINNVILGGIQAACPPPADLRMVSITSTEAEIVWTETGNAAIWNVEYGEQGFSRGTGTLESGLTDNSITIPITPGLEYDVYVQADCGEDTSTWTGPYSFYTSYCIPSSTSTIDYISGISTSGAVTDINYTASGFPAGGYSDQTALDFRAYETLTFDMSTSYIGGANGINVWIDWDGNMIFDEDEKIVSIANSNAEKTFSITVPAGTPQGTYRMRVRGQYGSSADPQPCGSVTYGSAVDFTVDIGAPPTCPGPTDLLVNNVLANSVEVSWTENGIASEWEVIYGEAGFDPETTGETVTVTNTPQTTLTDLSPNTRYDFYVKSICGGGDESYLSRKNSFRTPCVPGNIPFLEGFENGYSDGEAIDGCWSQTSIAGAEKWTSNNSQTTYNRSPRRGTWNAYLRYSNTDWIFYPLELESGVIYELEFYARQDASSGAAIKAAYGISDSPEAMTSTIIDTKEVTNGGYQRMTGYFEPSESGLYYVGILGTLNSTPWYLSIDDISVTVAADCLPPGNVTVSHITESTADLIWDPITDENEWEVIYGNSGFNPATGGTTVTVTDIPEAILENLQPHTDYDVYIRSICGSGDESVLSDVVSFFTGYCDFTSTSTEYYITDFITEEAVSNINNRNSGRSPGGYGNFTHLELLTYPSGSFSFEAEFNGGGTYGFNMWIDFNGDMEFDESEKVYGSGSYVSQASGNITIPSNILPGTYRMRIIADWLNSNPAPCGSSSYAEAEDYTVVIIDTPSCFPPTDLSLDFISTTTVEISWSPQNSENSWKIIYGEAGFDPATGGTEITVENTPEILIEGLESNNNYDVYVIALCDSDDESYPSGPLSFWTLCTQATIPYVMDFEMADIPSLPNCTEGENLGGGNSWETLDYNSNGFDGKVLVYRYSSSPANAWFYTQGIELQQGAEYIISYKYGNVSTGYTEKMKVAFGPSPIAAQMTTELADHPDINQGAVMEEAIHFSVAETGVYYFGFNSYSEADQFNLYLDDIIVDSVLQISDLPGNNIVYFPNPVNEYLTIKGLDIYDSISVYNLLGQELIQAIINNETEMVLNMSGLPSGVYLVKAKSGQGAQTFKIIKK